MFFYTSLLLGTSTVIVLSQYASQRAAKTSLIIVVFALTAFAGLRGFVGTDTYAYYLQFEELSQLSNAAAFIRVEPCFTLLTLLIHIFTENSVVFFFIVSVIQCFLLIRVLRNCSNPSWFLTIYVLTYYLSFHFNIIRAGTASLLILLAFKALYKPGMEFYLLALLSITSHFSAAFIIPILFFLRGFWLAGWARAVIMASLSLAGLGAGVAIFWDELMSERALSYMVMVMDPSVINSGVGIALQGCLIVSLVLLLLDRGNRLEVMFIFLGYVVLRIISIRVFLITRISVYYEALLIFMICNAKPSSKKRLIVLLLLASLAMLSAFGTLTDLANENKKLFDAVHARSVYLPYRFFWEE